MKNRRKKGKKRKEKEDEKKEGKKRKKLERPMIIGCFREHNLDFDSDFRCSSSCRIGDSVSRTKQKNRYSTQNRVCGRKLVT